MNEEILRGWEFCPSLFPTFSPGKSILFTVLQLVYTTFLQEVVAITVLRLVHTIISQEVVAITI
jgi:hypothetical protein